MEDSKIKPELNIPINTGKKGLVTPLVPTVSPTIPQITPTNQPVSNPIANTENINNGTSKANG